MAAGSDPLEDLLSSEVDEKAVSDLVGSLESQLGGHSLSAAGPGEAGSGLGPAGSSVPAPAASDQQRAAGMAPSPGGLAAPAGGSLPGLVRAPSAAAAAPLGNHLTAAAARLQAVNGEAAPANTGTEPVPAAPLSAKPSLPSSVPTAGSPAPNAGSFPGLPASPAGLAAAKAPHRPAAAAAAPPVRTVNSNTSINIVPASQNGTGPPSKAGTGPPSKAGTPPAPAPAPATQQPAVTHTATCSPSATKTDSAVSQPRPVVHTPPAAVGALNSPGFTAQAANSQPPPCTATATVKPAITVIAQPHVGVTKAASQSQAPPRPGIAAPQRVLTQQLIVRPQQQPATVQLAPGFSIPPGMILVRTESGQLVMVPQQALAQAQAQRPGNISSPRPSAPTSGPTFRLASTQQSMTLSSIRPTAPVQAKLITPTASATVTMVTRSPICVSSSSPQTVYTTAVAGVTGHHTVMSVQQAPAQQPSIAGGQPQASPRPLLQPQPATKLHTQVHLQPQVVPSSPLAATAAVAQIPAVTQSVPLVRGGQEIQENVKKCKNFLATLIKLASHSGQSADTSRNVKGLVQDLLDAKIEPEEFTNRLQSELKSSPQPYLVPFLKKSLPALRQSLTHNQQSILQVHTPATAPSQAASTAPSAGTITATVRLRQPTTVAVTPSQISLTPGRSSHLIVQSPTQAAKRPNVSPGAQVRMPMLITPSIRPVGKTAATWPGSRAPASASTLPVSATHRNKHTDLGGGAFKDDDDINDVASMAGVNLSEESARILVTNSSLVGSCIHSCKDEAFLASEPLHRRMLETAKRFGISDIPVDIVNTVSHATQERLKTVIAKLTSIAQHRMEVHKDEEWYEQATDVRTQLKFFEQLERLEKQRKDDLEREILLKAAKSRSRQEDPEQARLKQKAKEMQQQELAQIRQRDANLTALAAIGPRKKRKLDFPGQVSAGITAEGEDVASTPGLQAGPGASAARHYSRQRVTRINLKDLIFYMEQEPDTSHSLTLYRALLK